MNLEQKINTFLATAEIVPTKSKLEPYAELIRALRHKRWTYQRIAKTLVEEFGVSAAPSTIHHFQQVRAKRKNTREIIQPEGPVVAASPKRPRLSLDA